MTDDEINLIRLLGEADALHLPIREPMKPGGVTTFQFRRRYPTHGLAFYRPGADAAARKSAERQREALAALGWVRLIRHKAERKTGLVLTDAGEAHGRALAGLPSIDAAAAQLRKIRRLRDDPHSTADGAMGYGPGIVWVHETRLVGAKFYDASIYATAESRRRLVELEEKLLPALVRGWVVSVAGAGVWYGLTESASAGKPPAAPATPEPDPEAAALYYDVVNETVAAFASTPPPDPRDIAVPMIALAPLPIREAAKA